jgi:hypothetical protein
LKELTDTQIGELVEAALEAACRVVQNKLGIESGDLAAIFWSGDSEDVFKSLFVAYIMAELNELAKQEK